MSYQNQKLKIQFQKYDTKTGDKNQDHAHTLVDFNKLGDQRVMSSKPLEVQVLITELPTLVEKKSKQTDLNDTPEPMSLPINDLS